MGNLCLNDQSDPQLTSVGLSDLYFYKSHFSCFWFTYKIPDLVIKKLAILHIVWKSNIKPKIYNEISHLFEIVSFLHSLIIKLLITMINRIGNNILIQKTFVYIIYIHSSYIHLISRFDSNE